MATRKVNDNGPPPSCPQYDAADKTFERQGADALEDAEYAYQRSQRVTPTEFTRKAPWLIGK